MMHQMRSALRENRNGAVNKGDGFRIFHSGALRAGARKSAAPFAAPISLYQVLRNGLRLFGQ